MTSFRIILIKYGFIIFTILTFLSLGICLYILYKETMGAPGREAHRIEEQRIEEQRIEEQRIEEQRIEEQRINDLVLDTELTNIEILALEQQMEIFKLCKKILKNKIIEEKMNEDVLVIVNPDGQQLQLGTKIIN